MAHPTRAVFKVLGGFFVGMFDDRADDVCASSDESVRRRRWGL